jgi:hypothetical protein
MRHVRSSALSVYPHCDDKIEHVRIGLKRCRQTRVALMKDRSSIRCDANRSTRRKFGGSPPRRSRASGCFARRQAVPERREIGDIRIAQRLRERAHDGVLARTALECLELLREVFDLLACQVGNLTAQADPVAAMTSLARGALFRTFGDVGCPGVQRHRRQSSASEKCKCLHIWSFTQHKGRLDFLYRLNRNSSMGTDRFGMHRWQSRRHGLRRPVAATFNLSGNERD